MNEKTPDTKQPHCLYCGNNPVNHTMAWCSQTMTIGLMPLSRLGSFVQAPLFSRIVSMVVAPYLYFFEAVGLLRFSRDKETACSERSQVVWEEAEARGIQMEQVVLHDRAVELYRARVHGRWHYFDSIPVPPWMDRRSYVWIDNKAMLKKKLIAAGVPVAKGGRVYTRAQAEAMFEQLEKPVIVKPEIGSRGRHTTTNIHTIEELRHAFAVAQKLCQFVIVEEHLTGSVYRGTYVGGNVWGSLRGDPPRVTGNGVSTIAELITLKNATRPESVAEYKITDLTHAFLARSGRTLDTVLPKGERIDLSEKVGLSYGGDAVEDFERTHPKILEYLRKAGDALGGPVVGFDFIIDDVTKDPDTQKWGVLEGNALPFINLHHFPREGKPINVAAKVWDMWDRR